MKFIRARHAAKRASLAVLFAAVAAIGGASAASASPHTSIRPKLSGVVYWGTGMFRDQATGRCLDSNAAGDVYTTASSSCGSNDQFQQWRIYWVEQVNPENPQMVVNVATGRCLDSNAAGNVYTTAASSCGPNDQYQDWFIYSSTNQIGSPYMFWDWYTGRCLDSNAAGNAYTSVSCGSNNNFQQWTSLLII